MKLSEFEVWERVKALEGMVLYTYVEGESNYISYVEDNKLNSDEVNIVDRATKPTKQDILAAYELLALQGSLNRKSDLAWLARKGKMVSSIVFRIIGEITQDHVFLDKSKREPVLRLK